MTESDFDSSDDPRDLVAPSDIYDLWTVLAAFEAGPSPLLDDSKLTQSVEYHAEKIVSFFSAEIDPDEIAEWFTPYGAEPERFGPLIAIECELERRDKRSTKFFLQKWVNYKNTAAMAIPNTGEAPPGTEYGGDEVNALVISPGYSKIATGFAGEDTPKSIVPTYYGALPQPDGSRKYLYGQSDVYPFLPSTGLEIHNPYNAETGIVEDFERAAKMWEYAFVSRILDPRPTPAQNNGLNDGDVEDVVENREGKLCSNPVLMSEPAWNPTKNRERTMELAFEEWDLNAFYLAREGVLAGFGHGKAQALVIDVGASNVSVTPVYDGIVMKKGVFHSPLAGNFVSDQVRLMLADMSIDASPHYMFSYPKVRVDANEPPQTPLRIFDTQPTPSFRRLQQEAWVLKEFKEIAAQVYPGPGPLNESAVNAHPGRPFEFPSGYNQVFGAERFRPAEALFDANAAYTDDAHLAPKPDQTIPALVKASLNAVDVESRPNLLNNIVVVGGTSLLHGFTDRLQNELMAAFPSPRIRIQASGQTADRLYAPWVGGSILSSVGTFHQMWVSKKEYEEHGASIVEKRCK